MKYDIKGKGLVVVTVDADNKEEALKIAKEKFGGINTYQLNEGKCTNICAEIEFENDKE